jgi:DNA ligase-4
VIYSQMKSPGVSLTTAWFLQYFIVIQCRIRASNDDRDRHLGLVFFDILVLDSLPLTQLPYSQRRELLESVIETSVGHIFLAERTPIDLTTANPEHQLQATFAQSIANFEEGVVLKADESTYHDYRLPWVKLKKDYIPGYGDAVDLVILGASWDKKRGRELRGKWLYVLSSSSSNKHTLVPPTTYTTFYIGALANAKQIDANVRSIKSGQ